MSKVPDVMECPITLHGLGFIQVQLPANQRLHVWHPDLPRRRCSHYSGIHSHSFSFDSRILVGTQINTRYDCRPEDNGDYDLYLHNGPRMAGGGRPWHFDGRARLTQTTEETVPAGKVYSMRAYHFHKTTPGGDGRVATLLTKTTEGLSGAHSTCLTGVVPEDDFDRYQLSPEKLWLYVVEVLNRTKRD